MFTLKLVELYHILPRSVLARVVATGLDGAEINLCLHRVGDSKSKAWAEDDTSLTADKLDELLELVTCSGQSRRARRIVVSFDDGYADAVEYVGARYERFPSLEWMFFVCPAKTRDRVGFRWDAADPTAEGRQAPSIAKENGRATLRGLADMPQHRLATVDQLKHLASLPRVTLGNHTNCHFALSDLPIEDCCSELAQSRRDFETLFGKSEHFAFPFGVPGIHFRNEHLQFLAAEGYRFLYTTEPRPVRRTPCASFQLIPRFAVMGTWPTKKYALLIALISMRERISKGAPQYNPEIPS